MASSTSQTPGNQYGTPSMSAQPAPRPKRSAPWFDDGNIVIEAELSQFRVYRGILSTHSVIFGDMFALARPSGEGDVEGCPVVHLSDSAEDVRVVLKVLHDSFHSGQIIHQTKIPLTMAAAFLRLGTKYEIPYLRTEAIRRLSNVYPATLQQFYTMGTSNLKLIEPYRGMPFDVVKLAREANVPSILPAAFAQCIMFYSNEELLRGIQSTDGSITVMDIEDQKICILGKDKLSRLQATESFAWLWDDHKVNDCTGQCGAKAYRKEMALAIWVTSPYCCALNRWHDSWEREMCDWCVATFKLRHAAGRQNIWDLLPSVFELPPWEDLLKT